MDRAVDGRGRCCEGCCGLKWAQLAAAAARASGGGDPSLELQQAGVCRSRIASQVLGHRGGVVLGFGGASARKLQGAGTTVSVGTQQRASTSKSLTHCSASLHLASCCLHVCTHADAHECVACRSLCINVSPAACPACVCVHSNCRQGRSNPPHPTRTPTYTYGRRALEHGTAPAHDARRQSTAQLCSRKC